jgi:hypothetical protein
MMQINRPHVYGCALANFKQMKFMKRQDLKFTAGMRFAWTGSSLAALKMVCFAGISTGQARSTVVRALSRALLLSLYSLAAVARWWPVPGIHSTVFCVTVLLYAMVPSANGICATLVSSCSVRRRAHGDPDTLHTDVSVAKPDRHPLLFFMVSHARMPVQSALLVMLASSRAGASCESERKQLVRNL